MNRFQKFQKKEEKKKPIRRTAAGAVLFAAAFGCIWSGIHTVSVRTDLQQKKSLEDAVRQNMVACYALEGAYPQSVDYLKEHYGLTYDEERYLIAYEVFGSNLMPDVTVIEKKKTDKNG